MRVEKIYSNEYVNLNIVGATLLSIEEAEELPLKLRKYTNYWWLRSNSIYSNRSAFVHSDGSVYDIGSYVDNVLVAVRPTLQISNLNSSNLQVGDTFIFGEKQFEVISDTLAFCLSDIGEHCFRKHWEAKNANDYEKSDIKKYVDDWFNEAIKNESKTDYCGRKNTRT